MFGRQDDLVLVAFGPHALVGVVLDDAVGVVVVVVVERDEPEAAHVEGVEVARQREGVQHLVEGGRALELVVAHDVVGGQGRGGVFGDQTAGRLDVVAEVAAVDDELRLLAHGAREDVVEAPFAPGPVSLTPVQVGEERKCDGIGHGKVWH